MKRVWCALSIALLLAPTLAGAQMPQPVWRDLVREFDRGVRENDAAARQAAERGLRRAKSVRMNDGAVVRPDIGEALARIEALSLGKPTRDDWLYAATLKQLAEIESTPSKSDPNASAKSILAAEEFRDFASGNTGRTALERRLDEAFKALGRWLERFFGGRPKTDGSGLESFALTVRLFLYFLAGVLAVVLTWQAIRLARESGWIKRRTKAKVNAAPEDLLALGIANPLSDAAEAERTGDYRMAVRLVYVATLRRLRDSGWIALEANRTNGEYQRLLEIRSAELGDALRPATDLFDSLWYGQREARITDVDVMRGVYSFLSSEKALSE